VAAVRCRQAGVLRRSCHTARTPTLPTRKTRIEARPVLRIEVSVGVRKVGIRATLHEHVPNTY
jgi:hypothetical protein